MPDIDMDFCFERRDEVIRYVREKYGEDRVAQIITFGTLKGKAAIKDVGRVLDFTFADTDRIAKLYPAPKQGKDFPLAEALRDGAAAAARCAQRGEREEQLFDYALRLEGLLRHASKHAAGIVIGRTAAGRGPAAVRRQGRQRHDAVHRTATSRRSASSSSTSSASRP